MARCYSPKHVSEENMRKTSYQQNNCFRSRQVRNKLLSTFKASEFLQLSKRSPKSIVHVFYQVQSPCSRKPFSPSRLLASHTKDTPD